MWNLLHHAAESGRVRPFHHLVEFSQTQSAHDFLVLLGRADGAVDEPDLDFTFHVHSPVLAMTLPMGRVGERETGRLWDYETRDGCSRFLLTAYCLLPAIHRRSLVVIRESFAHIGNSYVSL